MQQGTRSRQGPVRDPVDGTRSGQAGGSAYALDRGRLDELLGHAFPASGTRDIRMPWTDRFFYDAPAADGRDVEEAVRKARVAQRAWAATPLRTRRAVLRAFRAELAVRGEEALDVAQLETGKARRDALEELADIALVGRYYDRRAEELLRPRRRAGVLPFLTRVWELRKPHGVVGVIAPWNYPLALAASDALPALLAGNAVVVKPDLQTSLSALWIAEGLRRAGVPDDVFQVVTGDGPTAGGAVVEHADFLMFTGSSETGRKVAKRAGERLIDFTLELGGKNALVVLEDADVDRAVAGILRGCFANAGQLCISLERVLVHRAIYDELRHRLELAVPTLAIGPGLTYDIDMGSLISEAQLEKTRSHIEDAIERGARLVSGGRARPDLGPWFHEPTILERVAADSLAANHETFGPVVSLAAFADEDEAVRLANRGTYGLNASVWTRDLGRGRRFATRIRAGTVNVNDAYGPAWASVDAPMGGFGDSGSGRRHGADGILKYTASQTVAVQTGHPLVTPAGLGHDLSARAVRAWLRWLGR